ncbi:hypothetical protein ALC57_10185 [Trachymyrmex cornetzi]|uniref:Transposase Tc5 C-terminal domain-containing protein n=1 Tax=Trachymyrmex cornetzi TaxID=471704 RepID=A0A151J4H9_9HYME|nr:hypothetical protein ALC57_10185 [Trachymyrmex cornetzi]
MLPNKFFAIPFFNSISEKFKPIANVVDCKLAYTIPNTLKDYIKKGKDKLEHTKNQNVVCKIYTNERPEEFENSIEFSFDKSSIESCSNIAVVKCSWCKKSCLKHFSIEYHYCNECNE